MPENESEIKMPCPDCGEDAVLRRSEYGPFLVCDNNHITDVHRKAPKEVEAIIENRPRLPGF